jgi:hypothetical protein
MTSIAVESTIHVHLPHNLSLLTLSSHNLSLVTLSSHNLSLLTLSTHNLSLHTLSTHNLSLHTLSTHNLSLLSSPPLHNLSQPQGHFTQNYVAMDCCRQKEQSLTALHHMKGQKLQVAVVTTVGHRLYRYVCVFINCSFG